MSTLDRTSSEPLYKQVERQVRGWIEDGRYRPGERLPSIRDLSAQLGVNYLTARQALGKLTAEGILASSQGRGTYVRGTTLRVRKIGLVVPHLGDPLTELISAGIYQVMAENGIEVSILSSYDSAEVEAGNLNRVLQTGMQGAIVFSMIGLPSTLNILKLVLQGLPVVLVDRYFEDVPTWHVNCDNQQGGYLATKHLIDIGRRRVAFISDLTNTPTRHRLEGYRLALARGGLVYDERLVGMVPAETDDTCGTTRKLLNGPVRPDAIFYGNDLRALLGMQEIKAAGLRVPEDIAVVGFDDLPMARLSDPPLTTIRQDGSRIGREAAELFIEQMKIPPDRRRLQPQARIIPVELVRRASA